MSQISSSTISGLSASMGLENECLVALADNGIIVATNIEDALGKGFLQKVGSGFTYGFDESLFEEKTASDWYLEDGSMCYFRASEMGYVRGADSGIYQIMAVMKTADVYRNRAITMLLLALGFFLILGLIFIQAHILVDDLVVKPMRDACQALDEIAKGSSERKVDERDTNEFIELSDSINNAIDSVRQQRERPRHT
jgi:methyl-accepting chemotaxis protein